MKKFVALLLAVVALFAAGAASYAAEDVVGYVDDMMVLQQYSKFEQARKQLNDLGNKKSNAAKAAFDKETDEKKKNEIVQNLQLEMREEEAIKRKERMQQEMLEERRKTRGGAQPRFMQDTACSRQLARKWRVCCKQNRGVGVLLELQLELTELLDEVLVGREGNTG